jgi:hypothetical protein
MEKNVITNKGQQALAEVVDCVKNHLEIAGYNITTLANKFGIGVDIQAIKNKENFIIIALGKNKESSITIQSKEILFAIGEIVRKMKKHDMWTFYGIAIPKSYFKLLKDFEIDGIHRLDFHLFIVENVWSLYHLDSRATIKLIQNLKAGKPERIVDLDIDFKNYDYNI